MNGLLSFGAIRRFLIKFLTDRVPNSIVTKNEYLWIYAGNLKRISFARLVSSCRKFENELNQFIRRKRVKSY